MDTAEEYAAALRAEPRSLRRKSILQAASNHLPPGALTTLYGQLREIGGAGLCRDAPQFHYMTGYARRRAARQPQLVANHSDPSYSLFTTPGSEPAQKRLFILFSGEDGQFYIPLSVVLHNLPKGPKDVLVLRSGLGIFYAKGLKGFGKTTHQVAQSIVARFAPQTYAEVNVLGFSAGGAYALRIADVLGADLGLSFGGRFSAGVPRVPADLLNPNHGFDVLCPCFAQRAGKLVNLAGAKSEVDSLAMARMAAIRPRLIRHYLINYGGHNVLLRMLRTRTLAPFIRLCLVPSAWLRAANLPFWAYGSFVRGLRRLVGVQKLR